MKIAIASDDQVQIAGHFGRTKGFLIFSIEDKKISQKEYVLNNFTGHADGHHHHGEHNQSHSHSHGGILEALKDCEVVISRGMGRRLLIDFESVSKEVFVTNVINADEAVENYLKGNLHHDPEKSCQH